MNKKYALLKMAVVFIAITSAGCSKSTEEFCQKTNDLMARNVGYGFTDTAMRSCLHQTPEQAERDYYATIEIYGENRKTDSVRISRSEFEKKYSSVSFLNLPQELGEPRAFSIYSPEATNEKWYLVSKSGLRYVDFVAAYETGRPGSYVMFWDNGFTKDPLGIADEHLRATDTILPEKRSRGVKFEIDLHSWERYLPFYKAE